jgi:hypothetical protein
VFSLASLRRRGAAFGRGERRAILCAFNEFVFCIMIGEFSGVSAALGFLRLFGQDRLAGRRPAPVLLRVGRPAISCGFAPIPAAVGFLRHF